MKIAYTTGTYDLVHEGHFDMLNFITQYGYDKIIVGLVTDEFGAKRKRPPILSYLHRKSILENSKYNVFVVPCSVSNKLLDYEFLKFDALFITDEYYNTQEYNEFTEIYPNIPVIYKRRNLNSPSDTSTTNIIKNMNNSLEYIDLNTIKIKSTYIKICTYDNIYLKLYYTLQNITINTCHSKYFIDNLVKKTSNQNEIYWWYLPLLNNKESLSINLYLDKYLIIYDGIQFNYRESLNSWDKYVNVHKKFTDITFYHSNIVKNSIIKNEYLNYINNIKMILMDKEYHIELNNYKYDTPINVENYIIFFNDLNLNFDNALNLFTQNYTEYINNEKIIFNNKFDIIDELNININYYHILIKLK